MKEERFLLSHVVYKICKNEKLQTRIRDDGAHMMLETRKTFPTSGAVESKIKRTKRTIIGFWAFLSC
jgi:hypothetical protein